MNEMEEKKNTNAIPIAIVVAGLLIAVAVIYANRDTSRTAVVPENNVGGSVSIDLPPVTGDDHILGSSNAEITIVEYSDTECPFCKNLHNTLHQVIDEYGRSGDVAWVYRHFPIAQLHSRAPREAEATECAAELGGNTAFWQYIDRLFEITPSNNGLADGELPNIATFAGLDRDTFLKCLESGRHSDTVDRQLADAQVAGGRGTPFSVIVSKNGFNTDTRNLVLSSVTQLPQDTIYMSDDNKHIALSGALPFSFFKLLIDVALGNEIPSAEHGV